MSSRPRAVVVSVVVLLVAGCGGAAQDESPPFDPSGAETAGGAPRGERPGEVARLVEAQVELLAPRVLECVPGRQSIALELGVRRSGTIFSVHGDDVGDARACVRNVLVGATVSDPLTAEMLLRHTFVRPPSSAEPPHVAAQAAAPSPEPTAPREDPTRAALAALLDAHAPEILACAGRPLVAVRARWGQDGNVALTLQGDLAGSAEEGCVRDALGTPTVAPGATGELVRLVRAP